MVYSDRRLSLHRVDCSVPNLRPNQLEDCLDLNFRLNQQVVSLRLSQQQADYSARSQVSQWSVPGVFLTINSLSNKWLEAYLVRRQEASLLKRPIHNSVCNSNNNNNNIPLLPRHTLIYTALKIHSDLRTRSFKKTILWKIFRRKSKLSANALKLSIFLKRIRMQLHLLMNL